MTRRFKYVPPVEVSAKTWFHIGSLRKMCCVIDRGKTREILVLFCYTLQRFLHENGSLFLESNGTREEAIYISHSFQCLKRNTVQGPVILVLFASASVIILTKLQTPTELA